MSTTQGKFVWYELMTSDSKAAESFYRSVIAIFIGKPSPRPDTFLSSDNRDGDRAKKFSGRRE